MTRWTTLVVVGVVAFAVAWVGMSVALSYGAVLPEPPVPLLLVTGLLALGTLAVAWPIRRWNHGERDRPINPLRAARTVALAKASALAGALLTGMWAAFGGMALPDLEIEAQAVRALTSGLAVLLSLALMAAGLLAERWCRIPPENGDDPPTALPNGSPHPNGSHV